MNIILSTLLECASAVVEIMDSDDWVSQVETMEEISHSLDCLINHIVTLTNDIRQDESRLDRVEATLDMVKSQLASLNADSSQDSVRETILNWAKFVENWNEANIDGS